MRKIINVALVQGISRSGYLMTSDNYSDIAFGIHSKVQRYSWVTYYMFGLLSSLIGDTLILAASFQKKAFNVNILIVTVIQHIAICDLTITITSTLPIVISLLANSWVLGDGLCYARAYIYYLVYPAGMYLIAVLTTGKFMILRYPIQAARWSTKTAHRVCCLIWVFALTNPLAKVVIDKDDVMFDYRNYCCSYGYSSQLWKKVLPMAGLIYLIVPNVTIVATTVPTLKYLADARKSAKRIKGTVPWQGALTVALTAVVSSISTLPLTVYVIGKNFVRKDHLDWFHVNFFRISTFLLLINIMSNFYVYTLTIKSFRRFLSATVLSIVPVFLTSLNSGNRGAGNFIHIYLRTSIYQNILNQSLTISVS